MTAHGRFRLSLTTRSISPCCSIKIKKRYYATLQIPANLPRLVRLPGGENDFILVEDIIKPFLDQLFVKYEVKESATFRVIRDLDLDVAEEDTSDLLKEVQQQLKLRERGNVIRLEVESTVSKKIAETAHEGT